jgi:aspartyl protease family protein
MNPALSVLMIVLMLVLSVSSLMARRLPLGSVLRMALAWVAIFALATIAVLAWQSFNQNDIEEPAPFVKDVAGTTIAPSADRSGPSSFSKAKLT